jgi:hypothetical protein
VRPRYRVFSGVSPGKRKTTDKLTEFPDLGILGLISGFGKRYTRFLNVILRGFKELYFKF